MSIFGRLPIDPPEERICFECADGCPNACACDCHLTREEMADIIGDRLYDELKEGFCE